MPELSILMRLKDEVTTKLKEVITFFESLTGKTKELAKTQDEAAAKTVAHTQEIQRLQETAEEYGRIQTDIMEAVAILEEGITEKTEEHQKAIKVLTDIAGECGARQTDILEDIVDMEEEATIKTKEHKEKIKDLGKVSEETGQEMVAASQDTADQIAKIQSYLTSVSKEENAKRLQDWNGFLGSTLDLTYETYEDLTEALGELTVKDREKLRSKFRDWKRTLDSITEEEKEFYRKAKGYMGDFRDMTKEELENVKELWEENIAKYEEIWDGFTQSVRSSFSDLFVDFMDGTKKSQDIWQDFCDSMVKSFKKAVADSLAEKMGLDKIFEGNILNWGNLFTGLGNLIEGVFGGMGKALSGFTTQGTSAFGTLGNVVGVFGKTLSGLVKSGGPLALVLAGMEALTRLVSGKSFIGGFLGGPMESEYSIEHRERIEKKQSEMEKEFQGRLYSGYSSWLGGRENTFEAWQEWLLWLTNDIRKSHGWATVPTGSVPGFGGGPYGWQGLKEGAAFLEGIKLLQGGAVFNKPTFFRAIAGEGGEPEFLSPESLLRKVVREEIQRVPSTYNLGPINVQFPNVTSFQDWLNADPGTIKAIFDRKIYPAMKMSAREGRISKEALLM